MRPSHPRKPTVGTRMRIDSIQWPACAKTSIYRKFRTAARGRITGRAAARCSRRQQILERTVAIRLEQLAKAADRALADDDLGEGHLPGPLHQRLAAGRVLGEVDLVVIHAARRQQRLGLATEPTWVRRVHRYASIVSVR